MTTQLSFRKILVAADFSPASQAALNQAVWLAQTFGAEITLVHVLPDMRRSIHSASIDAKLDLLYGEGASFYREVLGDSQQRMQQMITAAKAPGLKIATKTLLGEPFVEICRAVEQVKYDLVIAGTRGISGWKTFFVGSTARKLIRKCSAAVWVVKPGHVGKPQAVLGATDFSAVSRSAVASGLSIAEHASAAFHLLHVIDALDVPENAVAAVPEGSTLRGEINRVAERRFQEFASSLSSNREIQTHLSWGTPWQEVNRLASELKVDLIAMGTVGHSGIPGLLLGNTAEKVLASCDCSILTLKPEEFKSPISLQESTSAKLNGSTVFSS